LPFAEKCDSVFINEPNKSDYNFTGKYDGQLLPEISKAINNAASQNLLLFNRLVATGGILLITLLNTRYLNLQ
jgi:hypothetical protein